MIGFLFNKLNAEMNLVSSSTSLNDNCLQVEGSVSGRQPLGHESVVVDCSHSPASSSSSLGKQQRLQQQHHQQQNYVRTSAIKLLDTYQIHHRQGGLKRKLETSNEVQVCFSSIKTVLSVAPHQ